MQLISGACERVQTQSGAWYRTELHDNMLHGWRTIGLPNCTILSCVCIYFCRSGLRKIMSSEKWFESRNIVLRTHSVTVTCVKVITGHQPLVKIVPLLQIVRTSDVLDFIRLYFPQEVDHVPDVFITVENQFHRKNRRLDEIC